MATDIGLFGQPLFKDIILPFILVFVVLYAVLQKTQILGEKRNQLDAIVSFIVAMLVLTVPGATKLITDVIPVTGAIIIILLAFMLMFGFAGGVTKPQGLNKGLRIFLGIAFGIALIITVLWSTGALAIFIGNEAWMRQIQTTAILIAFIGGAFALVLTASSGKEKE